MTSEPTPHPWRDLRDRPNIDLIWADLPRGVRAVTDGIARIWLHTGLLQRERRSSLAHELEHHHQGHDGCQPPKVERHVRAMAAQYLLPDIVAVMDEVLYNDGVTDEAADALWVDLETLSARLDPLHTPPQQLHYAHQRWARFHGIDDPVGADPYSVTK